MAGLSLVIAKSIREVDVCGPHLQRPPSVTARTRAPTDPQKLHLRQRDTGRRRKGRGDVPTRGFVEVLRRTRDHDANRRCLREPVYLNARRGQVVLQTEASHRCPERLDVNRA